MCLILYFLRNSRMSSRNANLELYLNAKYSDAISWSVVGKYGSSPAGILPIYRWPLSSCARRLASPGVIDSPRLNNAVACIPIRVEPSVANGNEMNEKVCLNASSGTIDISSFMISYCCYVLSTPGRIQWLR